MGTTYKELYQRVLLRIENPNARALLACKEAVNDAQKSISRVKDFDELMVLDTSNALTVASTKSYHLVDDWSLTQPKDIYYLKYMDSGNSRKLIYKSPREIAEILPYEEILGEQMPNWYTRRGNTIDLIPVPAEAKSIYIYYSQWPSVLAEDTDESSFSDLDDVIIALGTEIAKSIISATDAPTRENWTKRAKELLGLSVREDRYRPDQDYYAQPFQSGSVGPVGEYWKIPSFNK